MSIDLGAILDSVTPVTASVLETSGTVVDIMRSTPADASVDPQTLKIVDATPERPVANDLPALITPAGQGSREDGPQRPRDLAFYLVKLSIDTVDVAINDVVVPSDARDDLLIGARLTVRQVGLDASGLFRVLRCERKQADGG